MPFYPSHPIMSEEVDPEKEDRRTDNQKRQSSNTLISILKTWGSERIDPASSPPQIPGTETVIQALVEERRYRWVELDFN